MKIRNYFLIVVMSIGFIAVMPGNSFAQNQNQNQKQKKQVSEKPAWMPSNGYKENVGNIYFPEQDMYYNIKKNVYIYQNNGKWTESKQVPSAYSKTDFSKAKKVEMTTKTNKPQKNNTEHKSEYKKSPGRN